MSSLNIRRSVVAVLSLIIGLVGTQVVFLILQTDFADFGMESIFVVIFLALAALIWLDRFLSAEILPD